MIEAVFFDLDGVIMDSGKDIAAAVNAVLLSRGLSPLSEREIISYVGNGAHKLLERSLLSAGAHELLPPSPQFDGVYQSYLAYYQEHSADYAGLYPGMSELLLYLRGLGIPCAVVTNKPRVVSLSALKKLGAADFFCAFVAPEDTSRLKPDPEGLALAQSQIGAVLGRLPAARHCLMVGDSRTDIEAARAFGALSCAVRQGLGNRDELLSLPADITVDYAGELIAHIRSA